MRTFKRSLALVLAIAMVLTTFGMTVVSAAQYNDTEGHWAESYINTWSGYGVIQGDGGYFRPDDAITRAEVAQVTDNVISYEKIADNMFTDVSTTDWFADAVLKLVAAGTLTGNGDGTMTPNNYMTREEAMTMLARAYGLTVENTQAGITQYADYQNISDYATGYVGAMTAAGYVGGYEDGTIRPKDYISRAEFVKIIDNMIKLYITEPGSYGPEYVGGIVMIKTGGVTLNGIVAGGVVVSPQVSGDVTITGSQISGDIVNLSEKANVTSNTGNVTNPSATTKPNNIVIGGGGSGGGNGGGPASLTVKFHYGENYGTVKTKSVTKGKKLSESSVPTPTESNWDGLWYTSKSAAEKCSGTTFDPTVSAVNKNYDLYAGHINNYDLKDVEIAVDNKTDYVNVYVGDVLTATNLAPAAAKNYVSYQWYRTKESNGTGDKISGATKSTYTAVEADKGMYLKVVVTGDGTNYNGTVSDVSTIVLAKDAPSIYPEKTTAAFGNDAATTVTLTEGQTITGVKTESGEMLSADQYTFDAETGKLTISKDYLAGLTDGQNVFTIVVSDDAAYNVTFVVTTTGGPTEGPVPTEEPEPTATVAPGEPTATVAPGEPTATVAPGEPTATAKPEEPTPTAKPTNKYTATVNVTGGKAVLKDANGNAYPVVEVSNPTEAPATEEPGEPTEAPATEAPAIDLTEITESYTFIADNFNSEGTAVIEAGTLLDNGKVYSPNGNTASLKKKKSTINGTEYNNSMRLKGSQNSLVFKAGMDAVVTVYGETHASRVLAAGTTNGGIELGKGVLASGLLTFNVSAGTTVYLTAVNDSDNTAGDVFMAGFTVEPAANAAATDETVQYIIPEGDVVTVDATPDTAGLSAVVTVKGADGQSVAVSNNKFTMPGQNVTADVTFSETPATPEPTATVTPEPIATATAAPATPEPTATATAIPPVNKYVATVNVTGGTVVLKDANGNVYPIVESEQTPAPATEAPATAKPTMPPLTEIAESYTFIADDFNSAGTSPISEGTMLDNGKVYSPSGNNAATNKKSSEFGGASHLNSMRLKGAQNSLVFKTAIDAAVTVYGNAHDSRVYAAGTTNGGVELGKGALSSGVFTFNVSAGTTVYLTAVNDADNTGGDLFIAGFTVEPSANAAAAESAVQYLIPEGDVVTVDATPDTAGLYPIVTVKSADGQNVTVSDNKFSMPGQNVTADVTFGEAPATPEPTATATAAPATPDPTATATIAPPTATPVFPSYANWNIGQAKVDTTDGAAAEIVYPAEGGKAAIEVTSRNIYTTLDQEVSAGQANVSLDVYINPEVPKNFRIYLESGTENYQNPNGEYVFAEVANNNNSSVNYGPNPAEENKLFDYSQMTAGWYKFNITLDYEGTDFITLEVTAPDGTVAGTAKMGAIAGKSTALRQVRLIQTAAAAQFADMAITVSGQPTATPVPVPNKYVATVNVTGGTAVLKDAEGNVYPTYAPEATVAPTAEPSDVPTAEPSDAPTAEPSDAPTAEPSDAPTNEPVATATTAPVTPVTYKYTSTSEIKGGNLCDGDTCTFAEDASDEIRALFADANEPTKVAPALTANYKNYVGGTGNNASQPYIEGINLEPGTYNVYYLGYNNEVAIDATIGDITFSIPAASGVPVAREDNNVSRLLKAYKFTFTAETALSNAKLTFNTTEQWLPDIFSVILTNTTVAANAAGAEDAVKYLIPEGDVVTVDATAETAGQIANITVTSADGQNVEVKDSKFTMPGQDVTADVTFAEATATATPEATSKPAEVMIANNMTLNGSARIYNDAPKEPTAAYTEEYSNIFGENFSKAGTSKVGFLGSNFGGYVTKNYTIDETGTYKAYILVSYAQNNNQFALSKDGTQVVQGTLVDKSEKVGTNGQDLFIYTYDIDNLEAGTYEFKYYSDLGQCSDFVAAAIVAIEAPATATPAPATATPEVTEAPATAMPIDDYIKANIDNVNNELKDGDVQYAQLVPNYDNSTVDVEVLDGTIKNMSVVKSIEAAIGLVNKYDPVAKYAVHYDGSTYATVTDANAAVTNFETADNRPDGYKSYNPVTVFGKDDSPSAIAIGKAVSASLGLNTEQFNSISTTDLATFLGYLEANSKYSVNVTAYDVDGNSIFTYKFTFVDKQPAPSATAEPTAEPTEAPTMAPVTIVTAESGMSTTNGGKNADVSFKDITADYTGVYPAIFGENLSKAGAKKMGYLGGSSHNYTTLNYEVPADGLYKVYMLVYNPNNGNSMSLTKSGSSTPAFDARLIDMSPQLASASDGYAIKALTYTVALTAGTYTAKYYRTDSSFCSDPIAFAIAPVSEAAVNTATVNVTDVVGASAELLNSDGIAYEGDIPEGDVVEINTSAVTGYVISVSVTAGGVQIPLTADNKFIMPNQAVTVDVTYNALHNVSVSVTGGNVELYNAADNSVIDAADYNSIPEGTVIGITATPDVAEQVAKITVVGATLDTDKNVFTVGDSDIEINVEFVTPTKYNINLDTYTNGGVSADKTTAAEGEKVTLTVTPDSGYVTQEVYTVDENTTTEAITSTDITKYTFTMPASDVTIGAIFAQVTGYVEYLFDGSHNTSINSSTAPAVTYQGGTHPNPVFTLTNTGKSYAAAAALDIKGSLPLSGTSINWNKRASKGSNGQGYFINLGLSDSFADQNCQIFTMLSPNSADDTTIAKLEGANAGKFGSISAEASMAEGVFRGIDASDAQDDGTIKLTYGNKQGLVYYIAIAYYTPVVQ